MDVKNQEAHLVVAESTEQKEFNPDQATKEIMQSAIKHLQSPDATTLDYQERTIFPETQQGKTRFIMLKAREGGPLGTEYGY